MPRSPLSLGVTKKYAIITSILNAAAHLPLEFGKSSQDLLKDEADGKIISEFVGLRAKWYAFDMDGDEFKKCKGVKKYVANKEITLNDYKNCLFSGRLQLRPMNVIRSHHHEVFT